MRRIKSTLMNFYFWVGCGVVFCLPACSASSALQSPNTKEYVLQTNENKDNKKSKELDEMFLRKHSIDQERCWDIKDGKAKESMPGFNAVALGLHKGSLYSFRSAPWDYLKRVELGEVPVSDQIEASLVVYFKDQNNNHYPIVQNNKAFREGGVNKALYSKYFISCHPGPAIQKQPDLYPTVFISSQALSSQSHKEQFVGLLQAINSDANSPVMITEYQAVDVGIPQKLSNLISDYIKSTKFNLDVELRNTSFSNAEFEIIFAGFDNQKQSSITLGFAEQTDSTSSSVTMAYKGVEIPLPEDLQSLAEEISSSITASIYDKSSGKNVSCSKPELTVKNKDKTIIVNCAKGKIVEVKSLAGWLRLYSDKSAEVVFEGKLRVVNATNVDLNVKQDVIAAHKTKDISYKSPIKDKLLPLTSENLPKTCQPTITINWNNVLTNKAIVAEDRCNSGLITLPENFSPSEPDCIGTSEKNQYRCYFPPGNLAEKTISFDGYHPVILVPNKNIKWIDKAKLKYPFRPLAKKFGNVVGITACGHSVLKLQAEGYFLRDLKCKSPPTSVVLVINTYKKNVCSLGREVPVWEPANVGKSLLSLERKYPYMFNNAIKEKMKLVVDGYDAAKLEGGNMSLGLYPNQQSCEQADRKDLSGLQLFREVLTVDCINKVARLFKNNQPFTKCANRLDSSPDNIFHFKPLRQNLGRNLIVISLNLELLKWAVPLRKAVINLLSAENSYKALSVIFISNADTSLILDSEQWRWSTLTRKDELDELIFGYPFQKENSVDQDIITLARLQIRQDFKLEKILYIGPELRTNLSYEAIAAGAKWQNLENVSLSLFSKGSCELWLDQPIKQQCKELLPEHIDSQIKRWLENGL